jgi:hypothetical protein
MGAETIEFPNLGRIVAGDKTPAVIGWAIIVVLIWLVWSLVLAGPDFIIEKLAALKKKSGGSQ